jgi:hypothetical protein
MDMMAGLGKQKITFYCSSHSEAVLVAVQVWVVMEKEEVMVKLKVV